MTRWDLVYKWADPETQSVVDAAISALENCDRKLTEALAAPRAEGLDVELLAAAFYKVNQPTPPDESEEFARAVAHDWAVEIAAEYHAEYLASRPSDEEEPQRVQES